VIQTIKMKKYGYSGQMNPDVIQPSSVVLKKYRSTRDVSPIEPLYPHDLILTQHFFPNNWDNLQPLMHQHHFQRIL
jgi:hypothetical protein